MNIMQNIGNLVDLLKWASPQEVKEILALIKEIEDKAIVLMDRIIILKEKSNADSTNS